RSPQHFDSSLFYYFHDTATTEIYTLSLHDALPIFAARAGRHGQRAKYSHRTIGQGDKRHQRRYVAGGTTITGYNKLKEKYFYGIDRKSTRLNSSHVKISYAVFCLKKKNNKKNTS